MYKLTPEIDSAIVKWVYIDSRVPIESQEHIWVRMCRLYSIIITRLPVIATYRTLLAHTPAVTAVIFVRYYIKTITKRYFLPVVVANSLSSPYISWTSPTTVILHSSIHIVRDFIINIDVIELGYRKVSDKAPCFTTISSDIHTAVISINHKITIVWMDPPCMVIRMNTIIYAICSH